MAGDWSDAQNDAIVADYFAMLADDIAGRPYSKAEHNRLLQAVIDRPRGAIEYKHQNISAVLRGAPKSGRWDDGNFIATGVAPPSRWSSVMTAADFDGRAGVGSVWHSAVGYDAAVGERWLRASRPPWIAAAPASVMNTP
ncbi:MAG: hypothetical protein SFV20_01590 [Sphingopyxis sp.]|nr:hypothetical protein [Sphingopyxis sp.]